MLCSKRPSIDVQGEEIMPEVTDDFVNENLSSTYGWTTVEEMRAGIAENLVESQRGSYISDYIFENSQVSESARECCDLCGKHLVQ